jgi:hypothetical protein
MKPAKLVSVIAVLVLLAGVAPALAQASSQPSDPSTVSSALPKIPSPPDVLGCYTYTQAAGWKLVPCATNVDASYLVRPTEGGSATSNPIYGVSISTTKANMGVVWLSFTTYSGEHDTLWGTNAYSVQTNTNFFTGGNGHTDWVQFTIQSNPNTINGYNPFERGCIWNIDVTTQTYTPTCVNMNIESLTSSYGNDRYVQGNTTSGGHLQAIFQQCDNGTCQTLGLTASDTYGLAGRWSQSSGTILGLGGGSQVVFTHPTAQWTDVGISAKNLNSASQSTAYLTGESNNLSYTSTSYVGCSSHNCWEDTTSTF